MIGGIAFGWYDYGKRFYDPDDARFMRIDALAEKYYSISPYAYYGNNPIRRIAPDGRKFINFDAQGNYTGTTKDRLELKAGAYWNSLKNSDPNGYAPQFDSSDDQYSIGRGIDYAKDQNYQNMKYKVQVDPLTPGVVVP